MQYFYDEHTDAVSLILSNVFDFLLSEEEVGPGVTVYLDGQQHAVAIDIRNAARVLDTRGLTPLDTRSITTEELGRRMALTDAGQNAWRSVRTRL